MIWRGTGGVWPEAPHLYRRGDWYYLVAAEGGTSYGHSVVVARATDPYGPVRALSARAAAHAPRPAPAADPGARGTPTSSTSRTARPGPCCWRSDRTEAGTTTSVARRSSHPSVGATTDGRGCRPSGLGSGTGSRAGPGARRARATPLPARPPSHGLVLRPEPRSRLLHPPGTTGIPAPLGNRGDDPRRRLACARLPAPAALRGDRTGASPVRAREPGRAGRAVPQGERGLQRGPRRGARPGRPGASPRRHAARRDVDARAARARGQDR